MTDQMMNTIHALDSLCANEFAVEVEGEKIPGIFRVSDLTSFKLDTGGSALKIVSEPFKITKMVQRDGNSVFNRWLRETVNAKDSAKRPTRTVAVMAIDDGVETRRWTVNGAWISEISYSDFNSGSFEMVEETVTIHYDSIDESWPVTG
jgi:phage tail-like protein